MTKLSTIIAAIVIIAGPLTPQPANAWVWFVAKQLVKEAKPSPKPDVGRSRPEKHYYAKPERQRSPNRYEGSDRESRYKRF